MENRITILGAGSFATAIAKLLNEKNNEVLLYTNSEKECNEINNDRTNKMIYENYIYPSGISATTNLEDAINFSSNIVIALPSQYIRPVLKQIDQYESLTTKTYVNVSKGLEPGTNKLISEIIKEEISLDKIKGIAIVSGPSFAEEILKEKPTSLMVASDDVDTCQLIMQLFNNGKYVRTYGTDDMIGVQTLGAIKNVIALAAGICDGMDLGPNAKAFLVTRGFKEMSSYVLMKGGNISTLTSVAGIGDLFLTCNSMESRNYTTGYKIGQGMSPSLAVASSKTVVEGVRTLEAIYPDSIAKNIEMPITESLFDIFKYGKDPKLAIESFFKRDLKMESKGTVLKLEHK